MNLLRTSLAGIAGIGLLVAAAGCRPASDTRPGPATAKAEPRHVHSTTGLVREIAVDRRSAVIRHEEIPGYMPAMTMELTVRETNELAGIGPGDTIAFRLLATDETHWIDRIRRLAVGSNVVTRPVETATNPATPAVRPAQLKPGEPMPEARFVDEDDHPLTFADLRGHAVAFTFFFTRCPLPDFCPRMNQNLAAARRLLRADAQAPTNWTMLSISFDPEFDRPAVLKTHARMYRGDDGAHWRFAVADAATLRDIAPRLDLRMVKEGGSISHNLRTVVVDATGRIHRQFDGNRWTAEELAAAIGEAARVK